MNRAFFKLAALAVSVSLPASAFAQVVGPSPEPLPAAPPAAEGALEAEWPALEARLSASAGVPPDPGALDAWKEETIRLLRAEPGRAFESAAAQAFARARGLPSESLGRLERALVPRRAAVAPHWRGVAERLARQLGVAPEAASVDAFADETADLIRSSPGITLEEATLQAFARSHRVEPSRVEQAREAASIEPFHILSWIPRERRDGESPRTIKFHEDGSEREMDSTARAGKSIYGLSHGTLYQRSWNGWQPVADLPGGAIRQIAAFEGRMYGLVGDRLCRLEDHGWERVAEFSQPEDLTPSADGLLVKTAEDLRLWRPPLRWLTSEDAGGIIADLAKRTSKRPEQDTPEPITLRGILSNLASFLGFGFGEAPSAAGPNWEALSAWVQTGLGIKVDPADWKRETARVLRNDPGLPFPEALARAASTTEAEKLKGFLENDGLVTLHQMPWMGGIQSFVRHDRMLYAIGIDGARKWIGTSSRASELTTPDGSPAAWVGVAGGRLYVASRGKDDPGERVPAKLWRKEAGGWKAVVDDPALLSVVSVAEAGGRLYVIARTMRSDPSESPAPRLFEARAGRLVERPFGSLVRGVSEIGERPVAITDRGVVDLESGAVRELGAPVYFVKQIGRTVHIGTTRGLELYDTELRPLGKPDTETGGARELTEADGRLWLAADRGVFVQESGSWKKAAEVEKGADHIAAAPGGVYIGTLDKVLRLTPRPSRLSPDWEREFLGSIGSEPDDAVGSAPKDSALETEAGSIMRKGRAIFSALVGRLGLGFGEGPQPAAPADPWESLDELLGFDHSKSAAWRDATSETLRNNPGLPLEEALARAFAITHPDSALAPESSKELFAGKPARIADATVQQVSVIDGRLYAAANDGLYFGSAGRWTKVLSTIGPLFSAAKMDGRLFAANGEGIWREERGGRWSWDMRRLLPELKEINTLAEVDGVPSAFTRRGAFVRRFGIWWRAWGWPKGIKKVFEAEGRTYAFGEKSIYEKTWYGWRRVGPEYNVYWVVDDAFEAGGKLYAVAENTLHRIEGRDSVDVWKGKSSDYFVSLGGSPGRFSYSIDTDDYELRQWDGEAWLATGLHAVGPARVATEGGWIYLADIGGLFASPYPRSLQLKSALAGIPSELAKFAEKPPEPASAPSGLASDEQGSIVGKGGRTVFRP